MRMACLGWLVLFALSPLAGFAEEASRVPTARMILVIGASGSDEYGVLFETWAQAWERAAKAGEVSLAVIGRDADGPSDRERLQAALTSSVGPADVPLWLVLIGHGTFDRRAAKFNLRGPDVSASDLRDWLKEHQEPIALIDTSAASAPFLTTLAGPNRVIVTATKSGGELNFARFGQYLAESIVDPQSDLDKDDQVSLWEAYLATSRRTEEFYKSDGRLLTEHALLDDNGDAQGTRADAFHGLEPKPQASGTTVLDGARAHTWHLVRSAADRLLPPEILKRRDDLEFQVRELRKKKNELIADDYWSRQEALLVELARLSRIPPTAD